MDSVLIDTSFCIRLIKQTDPLHQNALNYFEYFLENKVTIYLSAIAIAEYSVKDDINNPPLKKPLKLFLLIFLMAALPENFIQFC